MYKLSLPKIHKEGFIFIGVLGFISFLLMYISCFLGYLGFIVTGWCAYFFRDPDRITPTQEGLILSPADGIVHNIVQNIDLPSELNMEVAENWTKISIFLNIFDVHVNRVPISGKIIKSLYHHGKFFNAALDKASIENERQSLVVKTNIREQEIVFVQIAGLIARRIRCDIREGDTVISGQRFGLIRFGSRCDVYIPNTILPKILVGQKVIAGETILADLAISEKVIPLKGEIR